MMVKGAYLNYYKSHFNTYINLDTPMNEDPLIDVIEALVVKALKNDENIDFVTEDEARSDYLSDDDTEVADFDDYDEFLEKNDYGVYLDLSAYDLPNGYLGISNFHLVYVDEDDDDVT